jgi:hypothetical protein
MKYPARQLRLLTALASITLIAGASGFLRAETVPPAPAASTATPAAATDAARQKLEAKAARLVSSLKLEDAEKAARAKAIIADWLATMGAWHAENDAKLKDLWSQWSKARAVVPKDEFPGEVIAHQIDDVYATLTPAYQAFLERLATELSPEQIDTLKETWSRSPGAKRTYTAYLETVPDLTEEQKKVIFDRMQRAREDAMLTDADKEIVNIFKRHKVKVEAYIGSLEWAKLHKAYANRGKEPAK